MTRPKPAKPPRIIIFLDRPHAAKSGLLTILFRVSFANREKDPITQKLVTPKRIQFSTGFTCKEKHFDKRDRRVKSGKPSDVAVNDYLEELTALTHSLWLQAVRSGQDPYLVIRAGLRGEPTTLSMEFMDHYRQFLDSTMPDNNTSGKGQSSGEVFRMRSVSTMRVYRMLYKDLVAFQLETKHPLSYASMNLDFQGRFIQYLTGRKNTANTVRHKCSMLKAVLREFYNKGYHNEQEYQRWESISNTTKSVEFALTESELDSIIKLPLKAGSREEKVRDMFVFLAKTGIRNSDLPNINKDTVVDKGNRMLLTFVMKKTKRPVTIPLVTDSTAVQLLQKYNYLFPKFSITTFNTELKKIAEKAGITETYTSVDYIGNQRRDTISRKCDTIGSHTGRRTFATIAFSKGMNLRHIQEIMGHSTMIQTDRYIKSTLGFMDESKMAAMESLESTPDTTTKG